MSVTPTAQFRGAEGKYKTKVTSLLTFQCNGQTNVVCRYLN